MSSQWSLASRDSILSVASDGSILSIGSVGSAGSIGSVGSAGSVLSVGSAGSAGSADSVRGRPAGAPERRMLLVAVIAALAAVCVRRFV
jgi:hypothetical protein